MFTSLYIHRHIPAGTLCLHTVFRPLLLILLFCSPATGVQYVIHRYKQVLSAFNKKKSMSGAFRHYGIDRNTIANTAPIAELYLAAKDNLHLVGLFHPREETLVKYAQKCAVLIESDEGLSRKIEQMKATGELLPITAKKSKNQSLLGGLQGDSCGGMDNVG